MFLPLIQKRRSIRKFKLDQIPHEMVETIIEAGIRAPSSRDLRPWKFIVIDNLELLGKLATAKEHSSSFLVSAPLAIVVVADPKRSDVWIEDTSIAATYLQLAAESMNLGSCWVQIRERMHNPSVTAEEFVRQTLQIPDYLTVECIIAIGFPNEKLTPHSYEKLNDNRVLFNIWSE